MAVRAALLAALFCTLSALLPRSAQAAYPADAGADPVRGEELTAYVMTMGVGRQVWERFGHNAIWIRDDLAGTDIVYNYGIFSFEEENFLLRFVRGHMDYMMAPSDGGYTVNAYAAGDRSVWAQELNLTPGQRADLRDFLEWNALPENRVYRYDYYRDNCSTRVRDAIDRVLGGQIRAQTEGIPTGTTYRDHTRALTVADPPFYAGLMVGLGQPVDREISAWEEMFLPLQMQERLREVTVLGEDGQPVPLVRGEIELYRASVDRETPIPPTREGRYLLAGLILATGLWFTGRRAESSRTARGAYAVLAGGWSFVAGLLGLILFGLWAFTDHSAAYRNENLFFVTPLLLPLVGLLHAAVRGSERARRMAFWLTAVVAGISIVGFLLQPLPAFYQVNGEIIAIALPMNLALALSVWALGRRNDEEGRERSARGAQRRPTSSVAVG